MPRRKTPSQPPPSVPDKAKRPRRPATPGVEDRAGARFRDLRGATSQWEVARNLKMDGHYHPRVVGIMNKAATQGFTEEIKRDLAKVIGRIENGKHDIPLSLFLYACPAYNTTGPRFLESAGFAPPSLTIEDAIDGDPRLTESAKRRLRQDFEVTYLSNPVFLV